MTSPRIFPSLPSSSHFTSNMFFSSLCRSFSLAIFTVLASIVIVSGIIFTTVRAQQSGSIPSNETTVDASKGVLATQSNNYAASIAALTAGKPGHYHSFQNNHHHKKDDKYTEKLHSSSSTFKPSTFSLFSAFQKPSSSAYFNYADKHPSVVFTIPPNQTPVHLALEQQQQQIPISDSYLSHLYSPYMMPISNYYTGSSSPSSSSPAVQTTSPYQYSAFAHNQVPAASSLKPNLLSLKDRLLKAASSNRLHNTTKPETENEKLTKQLQMALLQQQLLALQQYRALYGGGASGYGGYGYPSSMAAMYQNYYQQQQQQQGDSSQDNPSASLMDSPQESSGMGSSASASIKSPVTSPNQATPEQLQQAIAETLAYRQQLALYEQQMGSGGGGYGGGASAMYGAAGSASSGFGYPSSLYSGASSMYGGGGGYGSGGGGYGSSSLYGSAMSGTGAAGVLSSLTGGLSALAGAGGASPTGGLGLLSSLGMLLVSFEWNEYSR